MNEQPRPWANGSRRRPPDPVWLRGLTHRRVSRRQFLGYVGAGGGAVTLSALLAACGGGEAPGRKAADIWTTAKKAGELNIANWPLYIDQAKDENGNVTHPSLDRFSEETGIEVNYREVIQNVDSFFGKIQPQLQAGEDTGYDLILGFTNGKFLDTMLRLGYVIPLDLDRLPNFFKYAADVYKDPSYDPGNKYTVPYQSGITGIGYDPTLTGREITSFMDLLDPAFKGKVGMFGDTSDLPNLTLLGMGIDPETSTPDDWQAAADLLIKQRDDGIVRQYYAQNYINALSKGDVALTMAWSGDIFQVNLSGEAEGLQFVVPEEGAVIWTDNMVIPQKAQHPIDAITYMNWVFQPDVQAMMAEWINYIPPVPETQDVIEQHAAAASGEDAQYLSNLAKSPLLFPTAEDLQKLHRYRVLTPEEEQQWNSIFQPVYQG